MTNLERMYGETALYNDQLRKTIKHLTKGETMSETKHVLMGLALVGCLVLGVFIGAALTAEVAQDARRMREVAEQDLREYKAWAEPVIARQTKNALYAVSLLDAMQGRLAQQNETLEQVFGGR